MQPQTGTCMRFRGQECDGEGVVVGIIDSGVRTADPRLAGATIEGWTIHLGATGHALIGGDFEDRIGRGTEVAAAVHHLAPRARIVAIRVMGDRPRTSADLMAAGIETAQRHGCHVINLSLGTPNMGKALLLRDCCALAVERGSLVLAAAHPKGERAYPGDLPETVGVSAHPDCPVQKYYYFAPHRFPAREWGALSGKFLTHGHAAPLPGSSAPTTYRGSGLATAYMAGRVACMIQALPDQSATAMVELLKELAQTPVPELGYR